MDTEILDFGRPEQVCSVYKISTSLFLPMSGERHRGTPNLVDGNFPVVCPVHECIELALQSPITVLKLTGDIHLRAVGKQGSRLPGFVVDVDR